jgi:hypothetical protein
VTLRFVVAQIHRPRPTFDGGIISVAKIKVGALQILEELGLPLNLLKCRSRKWN